MLKLWQLLQGAFALVMASGIVLAAIAAFFFFALLFRVLGLLALVLAFIGFVAYMIYEFMTTKPKRNP